MAESGHHASRVFIDQNGVLNLNGGDVLDPSSLKLAQKITFSPAAGSANVCLVTITVKDAGGNAIARNHELLVYLSDSAVGDGLTATTASGAVAAGASGTDLSAKVSKKALDVLTNASGVYILSITDTAKTGFYICAMCPGTGVLAVSSQLVTGNYG